MFKTPPNHQETDKPRSEADQAGLDRMFLDFVLDRPRHVTWRQTLADFLRRFSALMPGSLDAGLNLIAGPLRLRARRKATSMIPQT